VLNCGRSKFLDLGGLKHRHQFWSFLFGFCLSGSWGVSVERRRTGWVAGCGREKSDDQAGVEEEREGLEGEPGRGGGDVGCQGIHGSGCE